MVRGCCAAWTPAGPDGKPSNKAKQQKTEKQLIYSIQCMSSIPSQPCGETRRATLRVLFTLRGLQFQKSAQ